MVQAAGDLTGIEIATRFRLQSDVDPIPVATAPTPTELFLAGLAGCVAFYGARFLRRHGLATEGLAVSCNYAWAANPTRIGEIDLSVEAPGLTADRREAFSRVIEHCTVHNTLLQPPQVRIRVAPAQREVVSASTT